MGIILKVVFTKCSILLKLKQTRHTFVVQNHIISHELDYIKLYSNERLKRFRMFVFTISPLLTLTSVRKTGNKKAILFEVHISFMLYDLQTRNINASNLLKGDR